jgi:hypothetical protein
MVLPIIDMCTHVFNWVFFWAWIACEHFCEGLPPETRHGRAREWSMPFPIHAPAPCTYRAISLWLFSVQWFCIKLIVNQLKGLFSYLIIIKCLFWTHSRSPTECIVKQKQLWTECDCTLQCCRWYNRFAKTPTGIKISNCSQPYRDPVNQNCHQMTTPIVHLVRNCGNKRSCMTLSIAIVQQSNISLVFCERKTIIVIIPLGMLAEDFRIPSTALYSYYPHRRRIRLI